MTIHPLRLLPGQDLKTELEHFVRARCIGAAFVITCVGSLQQSAIRLADQHETQILEGKREIVSLTGTLSPDGAHLHIALSDAHGHTLGGHVMQGCLIYTTAEIILGEASGYIFRRLPDAATGYNELVIEQKA